MDRGGSPWFRSLNGAWKFHYSPGAKDRHATFFVREFDDRAPAAYL